MEKTHLLLNIFSFLVFLNTTVFANEVTVINQTDDVLFFEITMPSFEVSGVNGSSFNEIRANTFSTINQNGAPAVLAKTVMIEIPPECDILLEAFTFEKVSFEKIILAPAPEKVLIENSNGYKIVDERLRVDKSLYTIDDYYPGKFAELEFTGWLRDKRVARLNLYPVQYNPVSEILDVYKKIRIQVKFINSSRNTESKASGFHASFSDNSTFDKTYKSCLLNCNQFRGIKIANNIEKSVYAGSLWPSGQVF